MTHVLTRSGYHDQPAHEGDRNAAGDDLVGPAQLSCHAESWPTTQATIMVLRLVGEIDLCSQSQLATALNEALAAAPTHLVIDLAEVTFCGARGMQMLDEITHCGGDTYVLAGLRPHIARAHRLAFPLRRAVPLPTWR